MQTVEIHRWSETEPPSEARIRQLLAQEGLAPYQWANGPHDVYAPHSHTYHKVIYVVAGSIRFGLPETGQQITLEAGDRLELPPNVVHNAVVGPEGVVCLEAHR